MEIVKRKYIIYPLISLAVFIILVIPLALRSQVWIDEVLDSDPAYNLAFNNKLALSVWEGRYELEEHFFFRPPLGSIILAKLYKLLGFKRWVTLSLSVIPVALSLCIIYMIGVFLAGDYLSALLGALLFGVSPLGIRMAKWGRMDALAFFLFLLALFVFLISVKRKGYPRYLLVIISGILMSFSAQTYQLYALMFVSFILYFIFELRRRGREWFKEILMFISAFLMPFILWFSFIVRDIQVFKEQVLFHINQDTAISSLYKPGFFNEIIKMFYSLFMDNSPITLIFITVGSILFVRYRPAYKKLFLLFLLLPACLLFIANILRDYYIQILMPLAYVGLGFFIAYLLRMLKVSILNNRKKRILSVSLILGVFFISHLGFGIIGRYIVTVRDWKARDLAVYERELNNLIPPGSSVLGGPENWYALYNRGSRLFLFECLYFSHFKLDKIDYVVLPIYYDLKNNQKLEGFIKDKCIKTGEIGYGAQESYSPDGYARYSGYSSIIFRVRK